MDFQIWYDTMLGRYVKDYEDGRTFEQVVALIQILGRRTSLPVQEAARYVLEENMSLFPRWQDERILMKVR